MLLLVLVLQFSMLASPIFGIESKSDCLKLRESAAVQSTYLNDQCLALHSSEFKTKTQAEERCKALYENGHLAEIYGQEQLDAIAATLDLSNGAWIALEQEPDDPNLWQYNKKTVNQGYLPWEANSPQGTGKGALLRHDGIVSSDVNALHGFLCQASGIKRNSVFSGRVDTTASNPTLEEVSAANVPQCATMCHEDKSCQSLAYDPANGQCMLYPVEQERLSLANAPNSIFFGKLLNEPSCITDKDCLSDLPKVLIVGGVSLTSIESFYPDDPSKNQIVANFAQAQHGMAGIQIGSKALIVGGKTSSPLNTTYSLDLKSNTLTPAAPMAESRVSPGLALLNGVAIVCGGWDIQGGLGTAKATCEQFSNDQWSPFPSLSVARKDHELVATANKLFAIGGQAVNNIRLLDVDSFDPVTNTWSISTAPMPAGQKLTGAAALGDEVYVCRGINAVETCHKYSVTADQWIPIALLQGSHGTHGVYHCLKVLHGKLYAFGGSEVEIYDANSDQWQVLPTELVQSREYGLMIPVTF